MMDDWNAEEGSYKDTSVKCEMHQQCTEYGVTPSERSRDQQRYQIKQRNTRSTTVGVQ
jgi:hypothetical protein